MTESDPARPENACGRTGPTGEWMVRDVAATDVLNVGRVVDAQV